MVIAMQENTDSNPAKTYDLAYRLLTAESGVIWELLNLLHERPLSVSLRSSYNLFFSFFGLINSIDTGFCNVAFYSTMLTSPGYLLTRTIRVNRQSTSELAGWVPQYPSFLVNQQ